MKRIAMRPVIMAAAVAAVALFAAVLPLRAELPNQTIRIVFPFTAGASGDTLARLIAEKMYDSLDRTVIVENKLGADGRIGVNDVKMSTPDGTTLLLTPIAPISVYQHVYKKLTYDPINDFAPISQLATFDFAIAVGPQVPAKNLNDLIAWAKAHPTEANFAIPGAGTLPHFLGVLLGRAAKIDLRACPIMAGGWACRRDSWPHPDYHHHDQRPRADAQGRPHPHPCHLRALRRERETAWRADLDVDRKVAAKVELGDTGALLSGRTGDKQPESALIYVARSNRARLHRWEV